MIPEATSEVSHVAQDNIAAAPPTEHPDSAWVAQQTEYFLDETVARWSPPSILMHDRDTKFAKEFKQALKRRGVRPGALSVCSPNLNGRCKRVISTLKQECLRKFVVFGKQHLDYLLASFTDYDNTSRAHMERDSHPPIRTEPGEVETLSIKQVEVKSYVGGLVKSFERRAA